MKIPAVYLFIFAMVALLGCEKSQEGDPSGRELVLKSGFSVFYTEGWSPVPPKYSNADELVARAEEKKDSPVLARILITTERRRDFADSLKRLADITSERAEKPTFLKIGGWPALERTFRARLPVRGQVRPPEGEDFVTWTTTAISAGDTLLRLEGTLAIAADPKLAREALAIGRTARFKQQGDPEEVNKAIEMLRQTGPSVFSSPNSPAGTGSAAGGTGGKVGNVAARPGVPVSVQAGVGELEIAVSNDGQDIVIGANSGYSFSNDGGQTWTRGGPTPGTFPRDGDPSLATGASGNFYYGFIGFPNGTAAAGGVSGCATSIASSTDSGATFPFVGHAVLCPQAGAGLCFPDQEHIAADRTNAAPAGGDEVYSVWRNFVPAGAPPATCRGISTGFSTSSIVCSQDSGVNWTAPAALGAGDFPRVSVATDGAVYVIYRSGNNVMLDQYSSCANGLNQQAGFPVTIAAGVTNVTCPVPGLDRCNNGNNLSSVMVAPDDTNANHIYAAYATNTAAGNENIVILDSSDRGATWPNSVTINTANTARRFMPWLCSVNGGAYVSWFDRQAGTTANNDLPDYFVGGAEVQGGALVANLERNLSVNADPQCATGWPCGSRSINDAESCSVQPQLAGQCRNAVGGGSGNACDLSAGVCPAGETCQRQGSGCPKYGDYNGNACISNRIYTAWASATAPPGLPAPGGINIYSAVTAVSDFYVRDWTDSPTSGDDGAEPSTHTYFYTTSDVWNRRAATPGPILNDQPENEDAGNGVGLIGDNWAFARIRRNASPTTGDAIVSAHFLVSNLGTGNNFFDGSSGHPNLTMTAADPTITFNAADLGPTITVAYPWHLAETGTNHLCMAVQISAVGDAFLAPSLLGFSPGTRIRQDNNTAQRNMGLSTTAAGGAQGGMGMWAIVHNAKTNTRDMFIRYTTRAGAFKRSPATRIQVIGGKMREFRPGEVVALKGMKPGENRWIGVLFRPPKGRKGDVVTVEFDEMEKDKAVNGFALGARLADATGVIRGTLERHRLVFTRLAAGFRLKGAAQQAEAAVKLLKSRKITEKDYRNFAKLNRRAIAQLVGAFMKQSGRHDPFGVRAGLSGFLKPKEANASGFAVAHTMLLNKLNAYMTMRQLDSGDPADIPQNVRWQRDLLKDLLPRKSTKCIKRLFSESQTFLAEYALRRVTNKHYPKLLNGQLECLEETIGAAGIDVSNELKAMKSNMKSLSGLQKAHRDALLKFDTVVKRTNGTTK